MSPPLTAPHLSPLQVAQRLQVWFSPALPTGAFSHGHGIEAAIEDDDIHDAASLHAWLDAVLCRGAGRNDAILMRAAWHCVHESACGIADSTRNGESTSLRDIDDLARALCAGAERLDETLSQGRSFADATAAWRIPDRAPLPGLRDLSLPVVIGAVAACHRLPLQETLVAALQALVGNLAWIAARLLPLGQQATLGILATLEPRVLHIADQACTASLDELGSGVPLADLASLRHETQRSRVCRT